MSIRQFGMVLLALGGALLAVGLILGFAQVEVSDFGCGHAFQSGDVSYEKDISNARDGHPLKFVAACREARTDRTPVAWRVLVAGVIVGVSGGVLVRRRPKPEVGTPERG